MLKGWKHHVVVWIQAKSGITYAFLIWSAITGFALLVMFVFLCVCGYAWLSVHLGPVFGALAVAGVFLLISLCGIALCSLSRRRAKQRAILERAATAEWPLRLLDPKVLNVAFQAGRSLGLRRVVPLALLGFLALQLLQQTRSNGFDDRPV